MKNYLFYTSALALLIIGVFQAAENPAKVMKMDVVQPEAVQVPYHGSAQFTDLPIELFQVVTAYLKPFEITQLAQVNRQCRAYAKTSMRELIFKEKTTVETIHKVLQWYGGPRVKRVEIHWADLSQFNGNNLFGPCPNLEELKLPYCGLTQFPQGIHRLTRLKKLDVGGNELDDLPDGINALTELRDLILGGNYSGTIIDGLHKVSRTLKGLDMGFTNLEELPVVITEFTSLEELDLSGNPMKLINNLQILNTLARLRKINVKGSHIPRAQLQGLRPDIVLKLY